jgi:uncharacterized protein YndB with AHSA1/START domain
MTTLADDRFKLQIKKRVPAAREEVFRRWCSPEGMRRWLVPYDRSDARCDMDVRVGGRYRIDMVSEGELDPHTGEYQRIEPPSLLEFTWISAATKFRPSLVTVELFERGADTDVVLTHSQLPDQAAADAHLAGWTLLMERFWEARLERLEILLDELNKPH